MVLGVGPPPFFFRLGVRAETSHAESEIIQGGVLHAAFSAPAPWSVTGL